MLKTHYISIQYTYKNVKNWSIWKFIVAHYIFQTASSTTNRNGSGILALGMDVDGRSRLICRYVRPQILIFKNGSISCCKESFSFYLYGFSRMEKWF